jgi:hypothetical protein
VFRFAPMLAIGSGVKECLPRLIRNAASPVD